MDHVVLANVRINQVQSSRIASLETEITKLLSENIQLRSQVIQLQHRQDVSSQKAQLERKIREIHRIVKSLGTNVNVTQSPLILKKSPKKTNLLSVSPERSPERSTIDFISARSRTRLCAGPSRVTHAMQDLEQSPPPTDEDRERRQSRRMSRSHDEITPLAETEPASPRESTIEDRSARRRSRSSAQFEPLSERPRTQIYLDEDKENGTSQRRSTAGIRLLHSSPTKQRTALNVISDPIPSPNIVATQTPSKPLNHLIEVKSEPGSPSLELEPRSRRSKVVSYAEPSLRVKMRRTESLPGDKRRKSTYRRHSTTPLVD